MKSESGKRAPRYIVAAGAFAWAFFAPWGITGAEIGLAVALAGAIADIVWNRRLPQAKTAWLPMTFFLVWAFVCSSEGEPVAYDNFRHMWTFLMFFVSATYLDDKRLSRGVLTIFLLSLSVSAVYSIVQHYTGLDLMHHDTQERFLKLVKDWRYQVVGTFTHHLTLANVMLAGSVLAFSRAMRSSGKVRVFWLASALSMMSAMLFTFSHGPLLGLAAALVFLLVATEPKRALPLFGCVLLLVVVLFSVSHNIRYFLLVQWTEKVHTERLYLWGASLELLAKHPLFGVGPGNFRGAILPILETIDFRFTTSAHAHNSLLQYAVEFGIPGAIFMVCFFATLFYRGVRRLAELRTSGDYRRIELAACLAAIAGLITSAMTQHVFGDSEVALVAWLLCGIVSAETSESSKDSSAERAA